jgi:hypothetical protein
LEITDIVGHMLREGPRLSLYWLWWLSGNLTHQWVDHENYVVEGVVATTRAVDDDVSEVFALAFENTLA